MVVTSAFAESLKVSIDPDQKCQSIEHFAASDAWSGNFVGQYFGESQRDQVAKWLFSQRIGTNGSPEGIGLSMWRVNLGGGTLEQDGANIMPVQRRAESFLTKDGRAYDWNKCAGQQYFMRRARAYGCDTFLLFSNTPLVQWTRNGQGYGEKRDPAANLRPECYGRFADYLADVAQHFQGQGYRIAYVSPINEPQVSWDSNRQEGTPWRVPEMYKMFVGLDRALTERKLDSVKILLGESAALSFIYSGGTNEVSPDALARKFFDPASPWCVRKLGHMPPLIGGHSYHSEKNPQTLRETRERLREVCRRYGLDYQQTEWCFLDCYSPKTHAGFTADWKDKAFADIQVGLLLGRLVYSDFVYADAKAWGYWKGMEVDGRFALTSLSPKNGDLTQGGTVKANKLLWALGNYSFFVRPGYCRVALTGADNLDGTVGSAYLSPDKNRLVAVFVNSGFKPDDITIHLPEQDAARLAQVRVFRTDAKTDLGCVNVTNQASYTLAPRSLTTLVFDFKQSDTEALCFEDNFTNAELDESKWRYEQKNWEPMKLCFTKNNFTITNGVIKFRLEKEKRNGADYTGVSIFTRPDAIKFKYGKLMVRAKIPATKDCRPAIWLCALDRNNQLTGEIDILEHWPNLPPSEYQANFHLWGEIGDEKDGKHKQYPHIVKGFDISKWHIYTLDWDEQSITMKVDDQTVAQWDKSQLPVWPEAINYQLRFSLASSTWAAEHVDESATLPQTMEIDWIRYYKLK